MRNFKIGDMVRIMDSPLYGWPDSVSKVGSFKIVKGGNVSDSAIRLYLNSEYPSWGVHVSNIEHVKKVTRNLPDWF